MKLTFYNVIKNALKETNVMFSNNLLITIAVVHLLLDFTHKRIMHLNIFRQGFSCMRNIQYMYVYFGWNYCLVMCRHVILVYLKSWICKVFIIENPAIIIHSK